MNTELKAKINDCLNEIYYIRDLYSVMMDCINYHIACSTYCNSVYPLAEIIEKELKNLTENSDRIFYEVNSD